MIIREISIWKTKGNGFKSSKMELIAKAEKGLATKVSDNYELSPQLMGGDRKHFRNIFQEDEMLISCKYNGKDSFFKCKFKYLMSNKAIFSDGQRIKSKIELPLAVEV